MNNTDHGGAALALLDLVTQINENYPEYELIVVTGKKNNLNVKLTEIGIENYFFPFRNFISSYKKPAILWTILYKIRHYIGNRMALKKIEKKIDLKKIDIIHSNLNRIDIGAILAKKHSIPHLCHIREHLDVWYFYNKLDHRKFEYDFKVLTTEKNYIFYMCSFSTKYIAISNSVAMDWCKKGLSQSSIVKVYDGIKLPQVFGDKKWFRNKKINIVFVGGYDIKKGQELFFSYFLKLPKEIQMQYTLTFYGSGKSKYIKKLQKMSQHLCSDQVKFHSYIDNLTELLPNYDIGINFSTMEGFGRVTVEYLANGLCVVANKSGASPELITEEVGFLIDKDNQDEFIQLFTKLSIEKNKIRQMGNKAVNQAQKFSINQHTREIINVYQEMRNKQ